MILVISIEMIPHVCVMVGRLVGWLGGWSVWQVLKRAESHASIALWRFIYKRNTFVVGVDEKGMEMKFNGDGTTEVKTSFPRSLTEGVNWIKWLD